MVEIEGETHRLTGTVEAQYAAWRELLRRLFAAETGVEPPDVGAARTAATPSSEIDG